MLNHLNERVGAEILVFLSVFMHDGNESVQVIRYIPPHYYA